MSHARLLVRLPAVPLPGNNPGQVVHNPVKQIFGIGLIAGEVTAVYGRSLSYRPYNASFTRGNIHEAHVKHT